MFTPSLEWFPKEKEEKPKESEHKSELQRISEYNKKVLLEEDYESKGKPIKVNGIVPSLKSPLTQLMVSLYFNLIER